MYFLFSFQKGTSSWKLLQISTIEERLVELVMDNFWSYSIGLGKGSLLIYKVENESEYGVSLEARKWWQATIGAFVEVPIEKLPHPYKIFNPFV